ncbi:SMI1/KNR4 family protein [Kitasatospora sp. NBC_01246]|uniref:SMI1/KNR4 family protein n=1 Tax=Kitasatospora sp. NBC_01246 TaxID=2903570 RepID=UPI002E35A351|nr:SMI1/KNR4 family protein [Kitasatospora sp. NBC_01246]
MEPAEPSWAEELAALTGWSGDRRPLDWEAVERELGLCLPRDYKLLAETFGAGTFDDDVDLCVPKARHLALDLIAADRADFAGSAPSSEPTIRILRWARTSAGHSFCWHVADPDPEEWPVFARSDKWEPWERFDSSAAEFIHRMLTDPKHPYSLAEYFEVVR